MIVNVPTGAAMTDAALSLYFSAWGQLLELYTDFTLAYQSDDLPWNKQCEWNDIWEDYEHKIQRDLQAVLVLLQQSNELALKARLCATSPYLLLIGTDYTFSTSATDVEFVNLRTLDAVELPGVVNSFTAPPVSDDFIRLFGDLRTRRNIILHSGIAQSKERISDILAAFVSCYAELWEKRAWLNDRWHFGQLGRSGFFDNLSDFTFADAVLFEWADIPSLLTGGQFKKLFGIEKTKRRYLCPSCIEEASYASYEIHLDELKTAYLESREVLRCLMCSSSFNVVREKCGDDSCLGDVISTQGLDDSGWCHTCGS